MFLGDHFLLVLSCLCIFLPSNSKARLADDATELQANNGCAINQCFHLPVEMCPNASSTCRCRRLPNCPQAAICCNMTKDFELAEGFGCANITPDGQVEALHIRNATVDYLNVSRPIWRRLRYLTITDGHFDSVIGEFVMHTNISCLNLSSNGIRTIEDRSLVRLVNLNFLDLSYNNLTDVPRFKKDGNITLDILNNTMMLCSSILNALNNTSINFHNEANTDCLASKNFNWFNVMEVVPLPQLISAIEREKNCIKNCTCKVHRMEILPEEPVVYSMGVDCVGQNFTSLPVPLPQNTIALNITNNNITSLKELSDPSYQYLRELYADNNQITSIQPLEGTKFMSSFVVLSLKNNKIKTLEAYLLSNIKFDRNYKSRYINLGYNKLHCDCNTAKDLRVLLLTKQNQILDYKEIFCDNMESRVVELNPSKLCQSQQDWTDYIYYIIAAEVLLLIGLIAKVFYDYWVFKTAGYLPWPANKMPKLPCDWLCE